MTSRLSFVSLTALFLTASGCVSHRRCKARVDERLPFDQVLLDTLDALNVAIEADLLQIKAASSHVALLLEAREDV